MSQGAKHFTRLAALLWLLSGTVFSQVPGLFPWWDSPIAGNLGLTEAQKTQIRTRLDEWRDKIMNLNRNLEEAEAAMRAQFDKEPPDERQAVECIEKSVEARAELTRAVSMMSLRLRQVLTADQWRELQKRQQQRRPPQGRPLGAAPPRQG